MEVLTCVNMLSQLPQESLCRLLERIFPPIVKPSGSFKWFQCHFAFCGMVLRDYGVWGLQLKIAGI